jgi:hypothetical protein
LYDEPPQPQPDFVADALDLVGATEEIDHTAADREAVPPDGASPPAPQPEPIAAQSHPEPGPDAEPEAPVRRRSTVREPVPAQGAETTLAPERPPSPEPVITETDEGENSGSRRRTGWWARRFAGS